MDLKVCNGWLKYQHIQLQIINGKKKIKCIWIIDVFYFPCPAKLYSHRIDEYGEEVTQREDKNDKIYLKRNETLSKFIIKNLELSDSMVYKLIANNGFQEKQISVTLSVKGN